MISKHSNPRQPKKSGKYYSTLTQFQLVQLNFCLGRKLVLHDPKSQYEFASTLNFRLNLAHTDNFGVGIGVTE